MSKKAFISYASADSEYAQRIREASDALGWSAFMFEFDQYGGSPWLDRIEDEVASCEVFVVVRTPNWSTAAYPRKELEFYYKLCRQSNKTPRIVPLEFEESKNYRGYLLLSGEHIIERAAELSREALCWALYCGGEKQPTGPRSRWESTGAELIGTGNKLRSIKGQPATAIADDKSPILAEDEAPLTRSAWMALEDELTASIKSEQRIREICVEVLGQVPENLPRDSRAAWYRIIDLASSARLISKLRRAAGLDPNTKPPKK
jgi:hypothetical protein